MLKATKQVTLTGTAIIGGEHVVTMSAVLDSDNAGNTSYTEIISNQDVYRANVSEIRTDISQFKDEVYKIEDEFLSNGNPVDETLVVLPEPEPKA